jgi:hypothetical protein
MNDAVLSQGMSRPAAAMAARITMMMNATMTNPPSIS